MSHGRAAVVGAGLMGYWHARALRRAGVSVGLVVDPDLARAQTLAAQWRGCDAATSLETVGRGIGAVHICTPTSTHEALVRQALAAGCHVLVEKPLAEDAATTRALLAEATSRRKMLCPVHQVLFQRGANDLTRWLAARPPLHVDFTICTAGADRTQDHAGLVGEILPHPLSFIARFLPEAVESTWQHVSTLPGEFRAVVACGGASASILISTHGRPTINAARVVAPWGSAHLDFFHGFATFQSGVVSRVHKALQPIASAANLGVTATSNLIRRGVSQQPAYPGLWELAACFHAAAAGQCESPIAPREIEAVARLRDRLLRALHDR